MYKCRSCGEFFENSCLGMLDRNYDTESDSTLNCPECKSDDFISVEPCIVCGEYIGTENPFKMCDECEAEIRKNMKTELFGFCKKFNGFEFDILEDILAHSYLKDVIKEIKRESEEEK